MSYFRRPPLCAGINSGYSGCLVVVNNERKYLPLTQVNANVTLLASTSRTTLTQTFKNPTSENLKESRYVFPLFDGVSVVAFTCTIGKTVIKGVVKSKPEAKKEFDAAVARGEQAGLLEQSERASDVFTTRLGNVGPNEEAKVEITYLGELKHDAEVDGLRYTIPTHIAPRYAEDLVVPIPSHHSNVLTAEASLSVTIDVDLATGAAIKSVQSPSHPISVDIGTTSKRPNEDPSLQYASASLTRAEVELDKDFIVQVCAKGLGAPSAVLETHPTIPNRRAIMATLVPRFNLTVEKPEVVFICDRSGSMGTGTRLPNLVASLQVFLKSLPVGVLFNICSFGSTHSFLWPKSKPYNQATLDQATTHVKGFAANYGGTCIREPIEATFSNRDTSRNLEVFLMTDGEVWDENATFEAINQAVKEANGAIRLFALGVGADASHSLIEGVARAGRGFAQSVGENENMNKKVVRMLKGALTAHVNDYSLEIKYEKAGDDEFELVEKVSECTVVDSVDEPEAEKTAKASISLHDTSVKDEDLEMPDAQQLALPVLPTPTYLQAPYTIPPLFPFNRTSVYVLLSESSAHRTPKSVVLKGTSPQGPLELEIPIVNVADKGTTIHQLAARKAVQDLEEGRGWVYDSKLANGKMLRETYAMRMTDVAREAAVKLGVEYQVAGKWCSFVAVKKSDKPVEEKSSTTATEATPATPVRESHDDSGEDMGFSFDDGYDDGDMFFSLDADSIVPPGGGGAVRHRKAFAMAPHRSLRMRSAPSPPPAPMQPASYGFGATSAAQPVNRVLRGGGPQQMSATRFGGSSGGSAPLFGAPAPAAAPAAAMSAGLFGSEISQSIQPPPPPPPAAHAAQQQILMMAQQSMGKPMAFGNAQPSGGAAEAHEDNDDDADKTPLEAIIGLQTFSGSWAWSAALAELLGVTEDAAAAQLQVPAEAASTLCAIAYLQEKLADEEEVWELVVDKARAWLVLTLGLGTEDDVKALEAKARKMLA